MIRRHMGDSFLLFAQHDHAQLSGELARHYGNRLFANPEPLEQTIRAVGLHDCGWPLHDERPTLNKDGLPLDVFETPLDIAIGVWQAGVERVADEDLYTQLLVSLHVLGLSGFAAARQHDRREQFELNKFQHRQIERQVELRKQLGMALDVPLKLGLAVRSDIAAEENLRRNHNIVQTMDRISLGLCCTELVFEKIEGIVPRPEAAAVTLNFIRTDDFALQVEPWPFDQQRIELEMNYRAVAGQYEDVEEFRKAYADAARMQMKMTVHC
ncbi:MAG TPA: DUF3891 family protein [Tepidisphaeraceae bacterium]|jgi:hypothetical protein|nr:DUF3891 family protein [Tepidisphaeraceae bacterium]